MLYNINYTLQTVISNKLLNTDHTDVAFWAWWNKQLLALR